MIIDLDATLVTAHNEKQFATPTFKYGFGFHPLLAFCDHGVAGSGETLAAMLRPVRRRPTMPLISSRCSMPRWRSCPTTNGRQVLVRADTGGGVKAFLHHITDLGLRYSVGFYALPPVVEALANVPRQAWRAAIDGDGLAREGAQVAELSDYLPDTLRAAGRRACGSSPDASARIPGRNCG